MDFRKNDRLVNSEEGSQKELYWTSEQSDSSFPFHITKEEIHTYNEPQIQPDILQKKSLTTAFEKALELMTAQLGVVLVGWVPLS